MAMQRKVVERQALSQPEAVADIADLMNDWFFGSSKRGFEKEEVRSKDRRSSASRSTQEWLADAKRMVQESPSGRDSPGPSYIGSPRFAFAQQGVASQSLLDRRDPLSRSARRYRSMEGIGDEILSKSTSHSRSRSEAFDAWAIDNPPSASAQQRPTGIPHKHAPAVATWNQQGDTDDSSNGDHQSRPIPSRLPARRKSRFSEASEVQQPTQRSQTSPEQEDPRLLSPPRNLVESAHRRSISSSTCSSGKLPRTHKEGGAAHATSTTATPEDERSPEQGDEDARQLNSFLRRQRAEMERISRGESSVKAKIILSGPSSKSTTSSMVAAICYAWLLEKREKGEGEGGAREKVVVTPVLNMRRGKMWEHKQAAWLFQHVGIDAASLLFADEIDLEGLLMARQLSMFVIGQDILKTNNKVGSQCTILTNDYCEDAYDLLERENLKKLLLAGILLDIQNMRNTAKFLTKRDTEAVQLLLAGFAPTYKDGLLEQLMQERKDYSFLEAMRNNYGKAPIDEMRKSPVGTKLANTENPTKAVETPPNGKSKFSWGKWFGFKSK